MEAIFLMMTGSLLAVFVVDALQKSRKYLSEGK